MGKGVLNKNRFSLLATILNEIPKELDIVGVEFEGPEIVIYVRNRKAIVKYLDQVKALAKKVKKRIVLRVSEDARLPPEEAKKRILEIVPEDAGVDPHGIYFDEALGEVWIKTEKPGVIIGKGTYFKHFILAETGWRPVPQRSSPLESKSLYVVMGNLLKQSKYRLEFLRSLGERIHRDLLFKNNFARMTALGGFMEVGRSAILVETRESKVLMDLGINVGTPDPVKMYPHLELLGSDLDELDAIIVTHAHLDHVGLVPLLYKYGYRGPTYMTRPTRELSVIMLKDLIEVSRREGRYVPFSEKDIMTMILHTIPVEYEEVTDVAPDIKLTMYNAGHILGSSIVHLHIGAGLHNIVYTGDFKFANTKLLDRANNTFPRVETLIMESTYGATRQQSRAEAEQSLVEIVKRVAERKGSVLIPVFAVGRGQEILMVLNEAINNKLLPNDVTIYLEGLLNEVTAIHTQYPEYMSKYVRELVYRGENPFVSDHIEPVEGTEARADVIEDRPAVIIATSGMLTGGPAVEYLKLMASDERNALVFVGYQAEGTLGRKIKDGMREIQIVSENRVEILKINLEVQSIDGFSGHSDQMELLKYAQSVEPRPRTIILNHGEPNAIGTLEKLLAKSLYGRYGGAQPPRIAALHNLDSLNLTAR
ncbi:MAG: beta-CASP ribonuclease aCPSF1 [Desulfurococcaceae archaeon]